MDDLTVGRENLDINKVRVPKFILYTTFEDLKIEVSFREGIWGIST